jgi:hypothetical protein
VLLAASRGDDRGGDTGAGSHPASGVGDLLAEEAALGVEDPARVRALQDSVASRAEALHRWLVDQKAADCTVLGYGAASRAVALLCRAGVDRGLLPAVADASPAKQGRRMPATDIPVIAPGGAGRGAAEYGGPVPVRSAPGDAGDAARGGGRRRTLGRR